MKVHLIGIAGTGMGALARLLQQAGHEVRGSDTAIYPPMSDQLAKAKIDVMSGYDPANLSWGPDTVVVGNVCSADHPEVLAAKSQDVPLESFPSMVAKALLPERRSIVVAGTHGKTTTTTLCAWILRAAGRDPSFLIGGVPIGIGTGAHLGEGDAFLLEGDEYDTAFFDKKSKFLHYRPSRAILTSVEFDHIDIFDSFEQVRDAFVEFVATLDPSGDLIVNAEDSAAMGIAAAAPCKVLTYRVLQGENEDPASANFAARVVGRPGRRTSIEIFEDGESLVVVSTHMVGRYNVANVLAAVALARREGVDADVIADAVRRFRGVKRRQELVGMAAGVRVISDFAHHPTAVQLTVTAVRKRYHDKALHVCFEPRSSSSRRNHFFDAYAGSFDAASHVYVAPVFKPEKVPEGEMLDTRALAKAISARSVSARSFDDVTGLSEAVLEEARPGDTVLMLSSGAFGGLGERLLFGFGDPVCFADDRDAAGVAELLEGYELPQIVGSEDVETLVIRSPAGQTGAMGQTGATGVIGCVSLQSAGEATFLFGLAVAPSRRGQGLGWVLGDIVLRRSRTLGARHCYLVTNTATDFFAGKLGFSRIDLAAVDGKMRAAANFQASASLPDAVCMVLEL